MIERLLPILLQVVNEILAAAIVVIAASLLLYNLSRNQRDRVARSSGILLAGVTVGYVCDVFLTLGPGLQLREAVLRLQWLGILLIPAALFHLSDALLATTGLPSRGRRRRIVGFFYIYAIVVLVLVAFSNIIVKPIQQDDLLGLRAAPLFPLYVVYFFIAVTAAFAFIERARRRCLTRGTRRRMAYLQFAILTPAIGVFPYSVLLDPGQEFSIGALLLVNMANFIVILMLLFLAYPLSFFGSRIPDRVVKAELLSFLLRGPATGLLALVVIIFTGPTERILGLPGRSFMPFAVVAVVLLWQWIIALSIPWLERRLIYHPSDYEQVEKIQTLNQRLLTRSDLIQLLEGVLAASCNYLQVGAAFVLSLEEQEPELIAAAGPNQPANNPFGSNAEALKSLLQADLNGSGDDLHEWNGYWIIPLYSTRSLENGDDSRVIGILSIETRPENAPLSSDERQMLKQFEHRAERTLDDMALQAEIYAALEGLLPQLFSIRVRGDVVEYKPARGVVVTGESELINREQLIEMVRVALRHYWGGPGLTHSRLLDLRVVNDALDTNDSNAIKALRAVLQEAIDRQRPEGERKLASPEWTFYNILKMRFVENQKVRDVADRLAISESDLYRKQRSAIEAVADTLLDMEQSGNKIK